MPLRYAMLDLIFYISVVHCIVAGILCFLMVGFSHLVNYPFNPEFVLAILGSYMVLASVSLLILKRSRLDSWQETQKGHT